MRMLKDSTGITGQRSGVLPKGMQAGSGPKDVVDVESSNLPSPTHSNQTQSDSIRLNQTQSECGQSLIESD